MSYDNPNPEQETSGNSTTPTGLGAGFTKDDENNDQSDVETKTDEPTTDQS